MIVTKRTSGTSGSAAIVSRLQKERLQPTTVADVLIRGSSYSLTIYKCRDVCLSQAHVLLRSFPKVNFYTAHIVLCDKFC